MAGTSALDRKTLSEGLAADAAKYLSPNYGERKIAFTEGKGCWLYTPEGDRYLDLLGGIAVCCLGHCHPRVVRALQEQAEKLFHVSNLFLIEPQVRLAKLLVEHTFADQAFFCNSGAEANEAALKLAKKVAQDSGEPTRFEVVSLIDSFHGRTIATLSSSGQNKLHEGFKPLIPGFSYVTAHDIQEVTERVNEKTCAVIVEPIQGESGVRPLSVEYLRLLREICDENSALLIFDEIQSGMGRTGKFFAHDHSGVEADIVTLAKGLGNGFPIGAVLARKQIMKHLTPGSHGTTFGGNPLACASAVATLETLFEEGYLDRVESTSKILFSELKNLKKKFPKRIKEIRGLGLMVGIEFDDATPIYNALMEKKIVTNLIRGKTIRLLPPYVVTEEEIHFFVETLKAILEDEA
ncbi:MAG: aspartate aminotransferase family protein [Candidatus Omnitrophica bacterium]|nr:aspartate aminotransferase family protein [Candidatus Omnitrophota bacterium]MCA9447185.1 aspartate aminotransferase family protein [Candidatus Omnitrophota bacterium]